MMANSKFSKGFLLGTVVLLMLAASCRPVASTPDPEILMSQFTSAMEKYNKIQLGMSQAEVESVMGKPGVDLYDLHTPSPGEPPLVKGFLLNFEDNGFEVKTAYNKNALIIKSLRWPLLTAYPSENAISTVENYDKLKIGMSYDEVSAIMGTPGLLLSVEDTARPGLDITGSGLNIEVTTFTEDHQSVTYLWYPEDDKSALPDRMLISFSEGKVVMKSFKGKTIAE